MKEAAFVQRSEGGKAEENKEILHTGGRQERRDALPCVVFNVNVCVESM